MKKYSEYFITRTRKDTEEVFICCSDDKPIELEDFIYRVHKDLFGGALPNDWIYGVLSEAFEAIENEEEFDSIINELDYDPYDSDLYKWFNNSFANEYCAEVMEEFSFKNVMDILRAGNTIAKRAIYSAVNEFLKKHNQCLQD